MEAKERIENAAYNALKPLIGLPLLHIGRAADLLWVGFGTARTVTDRKGELREVSEYALHLECEWRLVDAERVLIGSSDMYLTADEEYISDDETSDHVGQWNARIMELIQAYADDLPKVERMTTDQYGGIKLFLGSALMLEALPNSARDREIWRFFQPYMKVNHFVMRAHGVQNRDDE